MKSCATSVLALSLVFLSGIASAHQPIMDMAPRWDGGYGIQTRLEHFDDENTMWLEGVYTWDRSIRATVKVPFADGKMGDMIVGLPLKKYFNDGARTGNWSFTPSVQFPTGEDGDWDVGASVSYSTENPSFYQLYDLYSWGDRTGLDINVGFAIPGKGQGKFALWDVSLLTSEDGDSVQTGPVFVFFRKNMMFRAEYKHLVYERDSSWSGGFINIGLGFVY